MAFSGNILLLDVPLYSLFTENNKNPLSSLYHPYAIVETFLKPLYGRISYTLCATHNGSNV